MAFHRRYQRAPFTMSYILFQGRLQKDWIMEKRIIVISGYFNPLHVGHLDYMEQAKKLGDKLIVIVNNDHQVKIKRSTPFMNESDRMRIVKSVRCVDNVVLSLDRDATVVKTLKSVHEMYNLQRGWVVRSNFDVIFANGGDRQEDSTPEEEFCRQVGIETVYGVGGGKRESSSSLIGNVVTHVAREEFSLKDWDKL